MPASDERGPASRSATVPPERLAGWLDRFVAAHGAVVSTASATGVELVAADGATASLHVPFPPMAVFDAPLGGLLEHVGRSRRVGVVLVRRGGHAVGVFEGADLVIGKVGSRYVQGRTAAGGWSQQRFARRRENQARDAGRVAAGAVAELLLPVVTSLDAVVIGGDRRSVTDVMADPRLRPLSRLVQDRVIDVPDPRQRVLLATPADFRSVQVRVVDPPDGRGATGP